jgi:NAD(P)-dependent dehydrogenase (short-subunit alcohol dehydrogenase family)
VRSVISKAVLITGCSSGIGRETAKLLASNGWNVYATARRPDSIADLEAHGCKLLALDVTNEESAKAAVDAVVEAEGAVGVMINNAGINELGAIETVPLDRVKAMFETNLFGMMRMCQLVLPGMREQRWGKIVNVGSMNGRFTWPGMGSYCATKHAIEATSDALRHEVRPFGVHVSLIEPGMVKTEFGNTAAARRTGDGDGPYADYNAKVADTAANWQTGPMAKLACGPEDVAETIQKALDAGDKPRARYRVAASAPIMLTTRKLLPDAAFDAFVRSQFPSPDPSTKA